MFYSRDKVEQLRQRYPEGTRICLDSMENDPRPIPSGTKGTVITVDDAGQLFMKWDNGCSLSLIPGEDRFHVIQPEEICRRKCKKLRIPQKNLKCICLCRRFDLKKLNCLFAQMKGKGENDSIF